MRGKGGYSWHAFEEPVLLGGGMVFFLRGGGEMAEAKQGRTWCWWVDFFHIAQCSARALKARRLRLIVNILIDDEDE